LDSAILTLKFVLWTRAPKRVIFSEKAFPELLLAIIMSDLSRRGHG
jgi:hypothetical protein